MKGYTKIDERILKYGKFEMWENNKYGDEADFLVTLNGNKIGYSCNPLDVWLIDNEYMTP